MSVGRFLVLVFFAFAFSLWGTPLSADCGLPHGETESPSSPPALPSDDGGGAIDGGAASTSTGGDTTAGTTEPPTTVQEQLGATLDPSKEIDIVEGEHVITAEHFNPYSMVRIYLEYIRWVSDMHLQDLMEERSEEAWEEVGEKAHDEAGVDEARKSYSEADSDYGEAVSEVRTQERIVNDVQHTVDNQAKWVSTAGRDSPDRHGLTAGEILDNLQKGLDYSIQKNVEAQNRMADALEAKNRAWNHYLGTLDLERQLRQQYHDQIMGGK